MRTKVEKELTDRLLAEGIIQPVQFRIGQPPGPIVLVIKEEGNVRIPGDHKVTITKVAKTDKYPIPRMDDPFALLSGGKKFSK